MFCETDNAKYVIPWNDCHFAIHNQTGCCLIYVNHWFKVEKCIKWVGERWCQKKNGKALKRNIIECHKKIKS